MLKTMIQGPPAENHWPKLLMVHQHSPNQKLGQDACKQILLRKNVDNFTLITSKHLHLLRGLPQSLSRTALLH